MTIRSIPIYPPPCPKHEWACLVTERSEFNDVNVQRSTISTIYDQHCRWWTGQRSILGPPEPTFTSPLTSLEPLFRLPTSSSKFDSFPNPQNPPNQAQNASKTLPQTLPKRIQNSISSYNARNPKKMQPFHTKTSFLTFPDPRKSSQNRCQNALKISFILEALLEPQK